MIWHLHEHVQLIPMRSAKFKGNSPCVEKVKHYHILCCLPFCMGSYLQSNSYTGRLFRCMSCKAMWPSRWALLTSMSSTSRFPSGLNWFVNAAVRRFCAAYNVPLKNREKIISSIPFYPALCHSVHLGKCSTCMIKGILKEKATEFNISIFPSPYHSVLDLEQSKVFCLTVLVTHTLTHAKDIICIMSCIFS